MDANGASSDAVAHEVRPEAISDGKSYPGYQAFGVSALDDSFDPTKSANCSRKRSASTLDDTACLAGKEERPETKRPASCKSSAESNDSCSSQTSHSSTPPASVASSQNEGGSGAFDEKSSKRSKSGKPKKDRSKLRKGKWTVSGGAHFCLLLMKQSIRLLAF